MNRSVFFVVLASLVLAVSGTAVAAEHDVNAADTLAMDWSRVPEYRMVPGDRLSIDLGPRADLNLENVREVTIRPDGRITMFPFGDIIAAGLTPMELQKAIVGMLSTELRAPRATVEVVSMAANQVHVLGRVQRAGSIPALPFMTVSQAIAGAGGFTDDASRNSVLLIHREGARTARVVKIPLDRTMKGASYFDPPVSRFDIVYVPRSTVGNLSVFMRQLFDGLNLASSTTLIGWELFNLDQVYQPRVVRN